MDPLSLTASIVGLISFAIEVTKTVTEYISDVRHAPAEARELASELSALTKALDSLSAFLTQQDEKSTSFKDTSVLYSTTQLCHGKLNAIHETLREFLKKTEHMKWYRRLIWPFKKEDHLEIVGTLRGCMQIFHFSLSIDGCNVLSKTSEEVSKILQAQTSASGQLTEIVALTKHMKLSFRDFGKTSQSLDIKVTELHTGYMNDERQKLLGWLSGSVDPSTNHNSAVKKREQDTGLWFLESDQFYDWMNSGRFLWLHGIPGCGKTVLSSTIIESVKAVCAASISRKYAYFYFDFRDTHKQDVATLLRSLLRQLCAGENELPESVHALYTRYRDIGHDPPVGELTDALFSVIDGLKKEVYLIMDALDEYPEISNESQRQELLDLIKQIVEHESEILHVLVTSRNEFDIQATLGALAGGGTSIQRGEVDADIRVYVRTQLKNDTFARLPQNLKQDIEENLGQKANGMFRWAVCQLDTLRACKKVSAVRKALAQLPKTLDETYARILRDIPESDRDEALSLFRWIALSNRPLTLPELAEAAVFRPQDDCLDPEDRLCCAEDVLRICHSLVSVSNERFKICGEPPKNYNVVQFAHFSVLEYLTSDMAGRFKISDKSANTHITACCFSYLLQTDQVKLSEQSLEDYPLLRYSAEYWFEHFRELEASAQSDTTWLDRLYEFFSQVVDGSFFNWLRIQDPLAPYLQYRFSTDASEFPSPLAYASLFGLLDTAKRLLEAHHGRYNQPLHFLDAIRAAALKGHYDLVQLLLYSGADASMTAEYGSSPLAAACSGGHYQIVKLLLDHGAELDAVRSKSTALFQAAKNGHVQIVDLLLECGADVNVPCRAAHRSALQVALEYRHTKIALRLLEKGADVNATAGWSGDALTIASANGDKEMVQLLLKKGADINAAGSRDYGNALVQASFEGHCEIVEWLLEAGADVNVYGGKLWSSALAAASERGHFDIAQRLIEAGADVNYESGWSGSPLEAAERNGDGRIIRLLLDHGAKREQDCK